MAILLSALIFAVFLADVLLGAVWGGSFLNDVQEMLVLLAASVAFVAGILRKEKQAKE